MDVIARLPDFDGQAADGVSAYAQVKMVDAPRLLRVPKSECPDVWIRLPRHQWPKSWSNIEDPVDLLERNLYGHPFAGPLCERQFEEVQWGRGDGTMCRNGNVCFVHQKQGLFLSVHVDDIKMAGRKKNMAPMWKKWMKLVDLDEPTSFFDHVFLECIQRECKPNETILMNRE